MPHYETFIVRIWSNGDHGLHGRIRHVASQEERDFPDLGRIQEFILEHILRFDGPSNATGEGVESREKEG